MAFIFSFAPSSTWGIRWVLRPLQTPPHGLSPDPWIHQGLPVISWMVPWEVTMTADSLSVNYFYLFPLSPHLRRVLSQPPLNSSASAGVSRLSCLLTSPDGFSRSSSSSFRSTATCSQPNCSPSSHLSFSSEITMVPLHLWKHSMGKLTAHPVKERSPKQTLLSTDQ